MRNLGLIAGTVTLFALASIGTGRASVLLTDFGSASTNPFTIDGATTFTTNQLALGLNIQGLDNGKDLVGSFTTADISSDHSILQLFGTGSALPASSFSITLFDSAFRTSVFGPGSWTSLAAAAPDNYSTLTPMAGQTQSGFDWTQIVGMDLSTGGVGSSINATFGQLYAGVSAVPEPSSFLALAGLGLFGFVSRRVRRSSVKA